MDNKTYTKDEILNWFDKEMGYYYQKGNSLLEDGRTVSGKQNLNIYHIIELLKLSFRINM